MPSLKFELDTFQSDIHSPNEPKFPVASAQKGAFHWSLEADGEECRRSRSIWANWNEVESEPSNRGCDCCRLFRRRCANCRSIPRPPRFRRCARILSLEVVVVEGAPALFTVVMGTGSCCPSVHGRGRGAGRLAGWAARIVSTQSTTWIESAPRRTLWWTLQGSQENGNATCKGSWMLEWPPAGRACDQEGTL